MKLNYLLPNKYKKIGWYLFVPTFIIGLYTVLYDFEPKMLDINVFSINFEPNQYSNFFGFVKNNIMNEIVGIMMIISSFMVAFSKEKDEDELIAKIRLDSLAWATYINYAVLFVAFIFVYDFSFLSIMIFNMFTFLLFFIARFNIKMYNFRRIPGHEK